MDPYLGLTLHVVDKNFELKNFIVSMTSCKGRHTAPLIAQHLDKQVSKVPGLTANIQTVCVSDNAANMLSAIPRLTKKVDKGLGCADHLINLVVKDAFKVDDDIAGTFNLCKELAQISHKSPLINQRLASECEIINLDDSNPARVKYCKIMSSNETRWNSQLKMLKSIIQLKPALEAIREGTNDRQLDREGLKPNPRLQQCIPTSGQFEVIEALIPSLEVIREVSECLQADKAITLCKIIPFLVELRAKLKFAIDADETPESAKTVLVALRNGLNKRFPQYGGQNFLYAIGLILHPYWKGAILKSLKLWDQTVDQFFAENDKGTTSVETAGPSGFGVGTGVGTWTTMELLSQDAEKEMPTASTGVQTKFSIEWQAYLAMTKPPTPEIHVLDWWKAAAPNLPLLAACARKYLCIPVSSASSERMFSTGEPCHMKITIEIKCNYLLQNFSYRIFHRYDM